MSNEGLKVTPALVMAIIRDGIDSGMLRSFSVSFKDGLISMVDFKARYFRPEPLPPDYRIGRPEEPISGAEERGSDDHGKLEKIFAEARERSTDKPEGWEKGAVIERGVASSAGSVLVRYELLDDGNRVGNEWFFRSNARAFIDGAEQAATLTDVTPLPGDEVKPPFGTWTITHGPWKAYRVTPLENFKIGAAFVFSGIETEVPEGIPKSVSSWAEYVARLQEEMDFIKAAETFTFGVRGEEAAQEAEGEEFIDNLPI